jgi:hypothetical protein
LRTAIELDKERLVVAKEAGITRQERLAKLQRDYKITMFRVREIVLEARVAELDDEVLELREHAKQKTEEMTEKYQGVMKRLKERCANLAEEIVSRADEMAASEKEKETLEVNLQTAYYSSTLIQCISRTGKTLSTPGTICPTACCR